MIRGLIFDKDGTLFDFNATWGVWSAGMITREAAGDADLAARLADALGFDMATRQFRPGSVVIAATAGETADVILSVVPGDRDALLARMNAEAAAVTQEPAADLVPLLQGLRDRRLILGLATNDSEAPARAHLSRAGVLELFDFVAGYDSGWGGKPAPGQLLGFCEKTGLEPGSCVMIGDSTHDLHAGRAAGMRTVGVLTGPAPRTELAPLADVVLDSIQDLPGWLDAQ